MLALVGVQFASSQSGPMANIEVLSDFWGDPSCKFRAACLLDLVKVQALVLVVWENMANYWLLMLIYFY